MTDERGVYLIGGPHHGESRIVKGLDAQINFSTIRPDYLDGEIQEEPRVNRLTYTEVEGISGVFMYNGLETELKERLLRDLIVRGLKKGNH